jgi:hypothetical protein
MSDSNHRLPPGVIPNSCYAHSCDNTSGLNLFEEHGLKNLRDHFDRYRSDKTRYLELLTEVFTNKTYSKTVNQVDKSRALTVLLQKMDRESFSLLADSIDLPELLELAKRSTPRDT